MRKILSIISIALFTVELLGSCKKEDPKVSVTGVTLSRTELTLTVGDQDVKLTAIVAPENATNKAVSWSSDKTVIATVDQKGNVHAVAEGQAAITVTTADGSKSASCAVTVKAAVVPEPEPEPEPEPVDVPLDGFYRDLFLDGGIKASAMESMPAAEMLGLSQDCLLISPVNSTYTKADTLAQDRAFIGSPEDLNGYLLYPDGAPRYRCIFVNGGNATSHGRSMKEEGRENFRTFVKNGGCYIGSCAGAFVAALGSDSKLNEYYIGLWPSRATNCHLSDARTGQFIDVDSPLLKYYDFGGDHYVADIYHNGGCCLDEIYTIPGTEVLTRYDYDVDPEKHNYMHKKPASWTWKADKSSGRVIMSGSHPENVKSGERRDLMAAFLKYAMDGQGTTPVKGTLNNGKTLVMDKSTADGDPAHTRIGDMQCHHFTMSIPEGARNVKVILQPKENFNFRLMLAKNTFAYENVAGYKFECESGKSAVASFESLQAGQWYVCVQCTSVPKSKVGIFGTEYTDTAILNGAAYELTLNFEQ